MKPTVQQKVRGELRAVVKRKDGTVEDLGVIASTDSGTIRAVPADQAAPTTQATGEQAPPRHPVEEG